MEELSIKQKAKRYDEAIEIARKIKNGEPINVPNGTFIFDVVFPELKEDENDKIRRVIIEHFVKSHSCMFPYKGFTKEQIIDWLEKQSKQKPLEEGTFVNVDEVRDDFMQEVYRVLDAGPTNDIANQIIDAFDNLPITLIQKPSEWNEEDECYINQLIVFCENCMTQDSNAKKCANWLKSLKDRIL